MIVLWAILGLIGLYVVLKIAAATIRSREDARIEWLFHTKVAGVSHRNRDRRSRQKIIREDCTAGERVKLLPEPENKHDPNAIGIWTAYGSQIGYLAENVARIAAEKGDADELVAEITEVTGGEDGKCYGVNLRVGKKRFVPKGPQ